MFPCLGTSCSDRACEHLNNLKRGKMKVLEILLLSGDIKVQSQVVQKYLGVVQKHGNIGQNILVRLHSSVGQYSLGEKHTYICK